MRISRPWPEPPGYAESVERSTQLRALRKLLSTPEGIVIVDTELKKARETLQQAVNGG